jgi:soluble lytic murein transglycosylase-like protein
MIKTDAIALIHRIATEEKIDPIFFQAICTVESSLNPFAMRYEPAWSYLYFARETASRLGITAETETQLQKFSYGLCQIMGSVAREHGFTGSLAQLMADPALALKYGAKHLAKFSWKYGGAEPDIAAAYNAGSARKTKGGLYVNQQYVDKVDKELRRIRAIV